MCNTDPCTYICVLCVASGRLHLHTGVPAAIVECVGEPVCVCVCGGDGGRVVDSHVLFRRCRVSQLWALLHFIMPTLFDSHDEFNEWFSRDIESHAENKSAIDESELDFSWLHLTIASPLL